MIKNMIWATVLTVAVISSPAMAEVQGESFDVLGSFMDKTKKEIDTNSVLKDNKAEAERYREKIIKGWWEFMQGKSGAKPGEYCMATFLQGKRKFQEGSNDGMKDGMAVMLSGPGGNYHGALLGFSPIGDEHRFPEYQKGKPIMVTLKQGNLKPVTLNAIYMTIGKTSRPMILFAVPNIEALMAGMKDDWSFEVIYQEQSIADITWHSGLKAREELEKCIAGEPFDNKSHVFDGIQ